MLDLETRTGARVLRTVRRRLGCAPSSRTSGRWSSGSVLPVVGVRPANVVRDSRARPSALVTVAIEYSAPTGWLATTATDESAAEVDQGTAYACPMHALCMHTQPRHARPPPTARSSNPQPTGHFSPRTPCTSLRTQPRAGPEKSTRETCISDAEADTKVLVRASRTSIRAREIRGTSGGGSRPAHDHRVRDRTKSPLPGLALCSRLGAALLSA